MRLSLNFVAPVSEWHILVCGEEALGCVDLFRDIYVRLPNDGLHVTATVIRTSLQATWQHWASHLISGSKHLLGRSLYGNLDVMRRFVEACLTGKQPEAINATDALAVLRMQHEILAAAGWSQDVNRNSPEA